MFAIQKFLYVSRSVFNVKTATDRARLGSLTASCKSSPISQPAEQHSKSESVLQECSVSTGTVVAGLKLVSYKPNQPPNKDHWLKKSSLIQNNHHFQADVKLIRSETKVQLFFCCCALNYSLSFENLAAPFIWVSRFCRD